MDAVSTSDLATFLDDVVNLKQDTARAYRDQVRHLRDRLALYVDAHPEFELVKMLHYGSLAKATALSTAREMDVAVYLRPDAVNDQTLSSVLTTLRTLLIAVYPQMDASQIVINNPAVTIEFRQSGLQVDVVPVIPNGKPDDRGILALSVGWVETSIPLHLEFIRRRAAKHDQFRPLIRLTKWWKQECAVPLPSFVIELIWAHLFDTRPVPDDLQEAMLLFFGYLVRTGLTEPIIFTDNYRRETVVLPPAPVQIADPVTSTSNVTASLSAQARDAIILAAADALDAVAAGSAAYSKGRAVASYQRVFGTAFTA